MIIYNPVWWYEFYSALILHSLSLYRRTPLLKHHISTLRLVK